MTKPNPLSKTMRIEIPPDLLAVPMGGQPDARAAAPGSRDASAPPPLGDADFQQLLQSVYDAAVITNPTGAIVDANSRAETFLRQTRSELCRRNIMELISGADLATMRNVAASLERHRFVLIHAHCVAGRAPQSVALFPAEIAVNPLRVQGRDYFCFFIRDVTLRQRAEEMLRTVHNAVQNSATGIAIADMTGRFQYVNSAAVRLWDYTGAEAMLQDNLRSCLRAPRLVEELFLKVREGQNWTTELVVPRRAGGETAVQIMAAGNRNADDELIGVVLSFVDVSDRRRAEEAERQAERQRVMVASLGAACHHLGQPATVLLASLELLRRHQPLDQTLSQELLEASYESAEALRKMLYELNTLTEYRTTPYIQGDAASSEEARILAVGSVPEAEASAEPSRPAPPSP